MNALCLLLIRSYQKRLSPILDKLFGHRCRFYPSCSHYASSCLEKFSFWTAFKKTVVRLAKCQPWHPGGFDHP